MNKNIIIITNRNCYRNTSVKHSFTVEKEYYKDSDGYYTYKNGERLKIKNKNELTEEQLIRYNSEDEHTDEWGYFLNSDGQYYYKYEPQQITESEKENIMMVPKRNDKGWFDIVPENAITQNHVEFVFKDFPHLLRDTFSAVKKIKIKSFAIFNANHQKCYGMSLHMNIQHDEIKYLDNCIGYSDEEVIETEWKMTIKELNDGLKIWFRDCEWNYYEPHLFVITGEFIY